MTVFGLELKRILTWLGAEAIIPLAFLAALVRLRHDRKSTVRLRGSLGLVCTQFAVWTVSLLGGQRPGAASVHAEVVVSHFPTGRYLRLTELDARLASVVCARLALQARAERPSLQTDPLVLLPTVASIAHFPRFFFDALLGAEAVLVGRLLAVAVEIAVVFEFDRVVIVQKRSLLLPSIQICLRVHELLAGAEVCRRVRQRDRALVRLWPQGILLGPIVLPRRMTRLHSRLRGVPVAVMRMPLGR